jgi:DNA-binding response OmpR family regulator
MNAQKIVLIEDDEILSKVLYSELTDGGFEVSQAFDGEAGLALVRSKQPDLVLLDCILPKKHGFVVLEELKKSPETKAIPVIMLTLLGEDEDIKKGLRLGANDYLVKSSHAVGEIVEKVKGFFAKEQHPESAQPKEQTYEVPLHKSPEAVQEEGSHQSAVDPRLIDYIKQAKGQGLTKEAIRNNLLAAGWQAEVVEKVFSTYESHT